MEALLGYRELRHRGDLWPGDLPTPPSLLGGRFGSTFHIAGLKPNRSVKSTGRRSRSREAVRLSGNFGGQFHSERLYYLEYSAETGVAVCGESFV